MNRQIPSPQDFDNVFQKERLFGCFKKSIEETKEHFSGKKNISFLGFYKAVLGNARQGIKSLNIQGLKSIFQTIEEIEFPKEKSFVGIISNAIEGIQNKEIDVISQDIHDFIQFEYQKNSIQNLSFKEIQFLINYKNPNFTKLSHIYTKDLFNYSKKSKNKTDKTNIRETRKANRKNFISFFSFLWGRAMVRKNESLSEEEKEKLILHFANENNISFNVYNELRDSTFDYISELIDLEVTSDIIEKIDEKTYKEGFNLIKKTGIDLSKESKESVFEKIKAQKNFEHAIIVAAMLLVCFGTIVVPNMVSAEDIVVKNDGEVSLLKNNNLSESYQDNISKLQKLAYSASQELLETMPFGQEYQEYFDVCSGLEKNIKKILEQTKFESRNPTRGLNTTIFQKQLKEINSELLIRRKNSLFNLHSINSLDAANQYQDSLTHQFEKIKQYSSRIQLLTFSLEKFVKSNYEQRKMLIDYLQSIIELKYWKINDQSESIKNQIKEKKYYIDFFSDNKRNKGIFPVNEINSFKKEVNDLQKELEEIPKKLILNQEIVQIFRIKFPEIILLIQTLNDLSESYLNIQSEWAINYSDFLLLCHKKYPKIIQKALKDNLFSQIIEEFLKVSKSGLFLSKGLEANQKFEFTCSAQPIIDLWTYNFNQAGSVILLVSEALIRCSGDNILKEIKNTNFISRIFNPQHDMVKNWEQIYVLDLSKTVYTSNPEFKSTIQVYDNLISLYDSYYYVRGNVLTLRPILALLYSNSPLVKKFAIDEMKKNKVVETLFKRLTTYMTDRAGSNTSGSSQFAGVGDLLVYIAYHVPELREEFEKKSLPTLLLEEKQFGENWSIHEWILFHGFGHDQDKGAFWCRQGKSKGMFKMYLRQLKEALSKT